MLTQSRLVLINRLLLKPVSVLGTQVCFDLVEILYSSTGTSSTVHVSTGVMGPTEILGQSLKAIEDAVYRDIPGTS